MNLELFRESNTLRDQRSGNGIAIGDVDFPAVQRDLGVERQPAELVPEPLGACGLSQQS